MDLQSLESLGSGGKPPECKVLRSCLRLFLPERLRGAATALCGHGIEAERRQEKRDNPITGFRSG